MGQCSITARTAAISEHAHLPRRHGGLPRAVPLSLGRIAAAHKSTPFRPVEQRERGGDGKRRNKLFYLPLPLPPSKEVTPYGLGVSLAPKKKQPGADSRCCTFTCEEAPQHPAGRGKGRERKPGLPPKICRVAQPQAMLIHRHTMAAQKTSNQGTNGGSAWLCNVGNRGKACKMQAEHGAQHGSAAKTHWPLYDSKYD